MTGAMTRKQPPIPNDTRPQSAARRSIFIPGPSASHSSADNLLGSPRSNCRRRARASGAATGHRTVYCVLCTNSRSEPTLVSLTVHDLKGQTVAFAASGGLDSCTVTKWLTENGVTVVCFTADMAQPDETNFADVERRMRASGAADFIALEDR